MNNSSWYVCHGVDKSSSSNIHNAKDAVTVSLPHDVVRHKSCGRFFEAIGTQKSQVCQSCLSLKYYLASRKRNFDSLTSADRLRRQAVNSTVSFDSLSPASKTQRLKNMRSAIITLRHKLRSGDHNSMELRDEQNDEMVQLVQSITNSDDGVTQLDKIYQETDICGQGRGTVLKSIWDNDAEMFFGDQKNNSKLYLMLVGPPILNLVHLQLQGNVETDGHQLQFV